MRAKEESCIPTLQARSSTWSSASILVHPILISFKKLLEHGKFQKVRSKALVFSQHKRGCLKEV